MKIGFKPKKNKKYLYTFNRNGGIIERRIFRANDCYLISRMPFLNGKPIHDVIRIEQWSQTIDGLLSNVTELYQTPSRIILGLNSYLGLCAQISHKNKRKEIELIREYRGLPIEMSKTLSKNEIHISLDLEVTNSI